GDYFIFKKTSRRSLGTSRYLFEVAVLRRALARRPHRVRAPRGDDSRRGGELLVVDRRAELVVLVILSVVVGIRLVEHRHRRLRRDQLHGVLEDEVVVELRNGREDDEEALQRLDVLRIGFRFERFEENLGKLRVERVQVHLGLQDPPLG
ncbi:hypothetical protein M885DRAFT_622860, partial [Pelagophyceae sp. CCMP2097]